MRRSSRWIYRLMLCAYPPAMKRRYGGEMLRLFQDRGSWQGVLVDWCVSLTREWFAEWLENRAMRQLLNGILASSAAATLIGWIDFRCCETGITGGLLLLAGTALGGAFPRRAWLWALILGSGPFVFYMIATKLGFKTPEPPKGIPWGALFMPLIFAFVAVGLGFMMRKGAALVVRSAV